MHTPPAQSCLPEPQLIALFESALATVKVLPSFTVPEHERRATGMALEGGLREVRCALLPPRGRTSPWATGTYAAAPPVIDCCCALVALTTLTWHGCARGGRGPVRSFAVLSVSASASSSFRPHPQAR
jgi:hypothetical protein